MRSKVNFILHPIRMRIIQWILTQQETTAAEISSALPDVPQATLYRHINKLLEAEAIKVIRENQTRGTVEKVISLNIKQGQIKPLADIETPQEHFEAFFSFLMILLGDFQDVLKENSTSLKEKGVMYRQSKVFLNDEELIEIAGKIQEILLEKTTNQPLPGRKLRTITSIILPKPEGAGNSKAK